MFLSLEIIGLTVRAGGRAGAAARRARGLVSVRDRGRERENIYIYMYIYIYVYIDIYLYVYIYVYLYIYIYIYNRFGLTVRAGGRAGAAARRPRKKRLLEPFPRPLGYWRRCPTTHFPHPQLG